MATQGEKPGQPGALTKTAPRDAGAAGREPLPDANFIVTEQTEFGTRREQLGQTLSISHLLKKFTVSGEIWHFTQPYFSSNAVGNLWALSYPVRRNLVLDGGFDHGLTTTSTHWEEFIGFTYLLPHRLWPK